MSALVAAVGFSGLLGLSYARTRTMGLFIISVELQQWIMPHPSQEAVGCQVTTEVGKKKTEIPC